MSEHAYELSPDTDPGLSLLADEAAGGDVVYLTRLGQRVAAVVSLAAGAAGVAALEAAEDAEDSAAALAAEADWAADTYQTLPYLGVRAEADARDSAGGR